MTDIDPERAAELTRKFRKELSAGTVALLLLSILAQAEEDLYGYQIAKRLAASEQAPLATKQGALYPVLRTLSANGLLASRVVPSYAGPPRRYYRITPLGRRVLADWVRVWTETRGFIDGVIHSSAGPETIS
jgi:PadR family transcriptional regulator PadR